MRNSFDKNQVYVIFDWLLANKKLKVKKKYKQMGYEELKGKSYCKCHGVIDHLTNKFVIFKDIIQDLI